MKKIKKERKKEITKTFEFIYINSCDNETYLITSAYDLLLFFFEYLRPRHSPYSSIACKALSNISFVCEELKQNLTRDSVRRVAGNPTPTTAMPFLSIKRLNALKYKTNKLFKS